MKKILLFLSAIAMAGTVALIGQSEVVKDGAGNTLLTYTDQSRNPVFETTSHVPVTLASGTAVSWVLNAGARQELVMAAGTTAVTVSATGTNAIASRLYIANTGTAAKVIGWSGATAIGIGTATTLPVSVAAGKVLMVDAEQGLGTAASRVIHAHWKAHQ